MVYVEGGHTPCQSTSLHLSLGFPIPLGSTINRRNADSPAPFSTPADAPLRWSQLPQKRLRLLTMSSEHRALNALCLLSEPRQPTEKSGSPCPPRLPGSRAPAQAHSRRPVLRDRVDTFTLTGAERCAFRPSQGHRLLPVYAASGASAAGCPVPRGTLTQTRPDPG